MSLRSVLVSSLLVSMIACTKTSEQPKPAATRSAAPLPADPSGTAPASAPVVESTSTSTVPWPSTLPTPSLPTEKKPIVVNGYPVPLRTCLPDPADHAGFTKDGTELGYCSSGMGEHCAFLAKDGKLREDRIGGPDSSPSDKLKQKELEKWLETSGVPKLRLDDCKFYPPKLEGSWRFSDITLSIVSVDATYKKTAKGDEPLSEAVVRIGGAVGNEKPVYPLSLGRPGRKANEPARYSNGTNVNLLALSPDGTEIGIITHTNCMEYCDEFEIVRMPIERFASLVYNDVGYRAYKANDLARAADFFAKAAYLDPTRELPAYNLACVYAKQKDASHAEAALDLAIKRGGDPVKSRAAKDADFALVKTEPWFTRLTGS